MEGENSRNDFSLLARTEARPCEQQRNDPGLEYRAIVRYMEEPMKYQHTRTGVERHTSSSDTSHSDVILDEPQREKQQEQQQHQHWQTPMVDNILAGVGGWADEYLAKKESLHFNLLQLIKMSPSTAAPSFIIVGAGIFGASTAYHLAKAIPSAAITLIDRSPYPCPLAASYDYNKIVRADYGDKFYMSLALKSQHQWRTDPLYNQFFHESGMVNIEGTGLGRRMVQNFKDLGVESKAEVVGPEELTKRYPLFWDADYKKAKD
ncbi:MAG: hypothetical protein Q9184_003417 [Pyrenodesmia sp. 2 TL-2023]